MRPLNLAPEALAAAHLKRTDQTNVLSWSSGKYDVSVEIDRRSLLGSRFALKRDGALSEETIYGGGWPTETGVTLPSSVLDVGYLIPKKAYLIELLSFTHVSTNVQQSDFTIKTRPDAKIDHDRASADGK